MARATYFPNGVSIANDSFLQQAGYQGRGVGKIIEIVSDFEGDDTDYFDVHTGTNGAVTALTSAANGIASINAGSGTGAGASLQGHSVFTAGSGKPIIMQARCAFSDAGAAAESGYAVGLWAHASSLNLLSEIVNGFQLIKQENSTTWEVRIRISSSSTNITLDAANLAKLQGLGDLTDFVEITVVHDGNIGWKCLLDGDNIGEFEDTNGDFTGGFFGPGFLSSPGASPATITDLTMYVDYVECAQEIVR